MGTLVSAVRKWAVYLKAAPEVVFLTDHNALKWMRRQKDPRHTMARWLLELEELPYRIEYRPGAENCVADYLSRTPNLPYDEDLNEEDRFEDRVYYTGTTFDSRRIFEGQRRDPVIWGALRQLRESGKVTSGQMKRVAGHLNERKGALFFEDRIVVPQTLRNDTLRLVHSRAHFGQTGTIAALRRSYFWMKMARDAKVYCKECLTCQKVKGANQRKQPMSEFILEDCSPGN